MRLIEFGPAATLNADDLLGGVGLRDLWDVDARLQFDLGVRLDWGLRRESPTLAPRFGRPLSAGSGRPHDDQGERGVVRRPCAARRARLRPVPARGSTRRSIPRPAPRYQRSLLSPAGTELVLPRATGVAIELEHQLRPGLETQVSVRQRHGSDLPTVQVPAAGGLTPLVHTGTSTYRELAVSMHQTWKEDRQLFVSYVRAMSRGEMNDFGTLFVNLDAPLLEPAGQAPMTADVPHRLRAWATFGLPHAIVVSPSVDWRTGFPYSVQDVYRHYVGEPNSARFPNHFAVDMTVYKTFELGRHQADLGMQFFNLTSHFNPRDVITVTESPQFGTFTNSFGITLGGYMQVRW